MTSVSLKEVSWRKFCLYFSLLLHAKFSKGQAITFGLMVPYDLPDNATIISGNYYISAALLAKEKVSLLNGRSLDFTWNSTGCSDDDSLRTLTTQWKNGVSAIIGPGCRCETQAKLAAALNIPLLSQLCTNDKLSDKTKYPTFTRTIPSNSRLAPPLLKLVQYYNWKWIGLVIEDSPDWVQRGQAIYKLLTANGVNVAIQRTIPSSAVYTTDGNGTYYEKVLRDMRELTRIYVFATDYSLAREGVAYAGKLGLNVSHHAFIIFALDHGLVWNNTATPSTWFKGNHPSTYEQLRTAMEAALLISVNPKRTSEYETFVTSLKSRSGDAPFYSTVYQGAGSSIEPPIQGAYLYDAIVQYGKALNRTLSAGGSISDGKEVLSNMKSRSFTSILGYDRYINAEGDAEFDLVLMDYRKSPPSEEFKEVGHFGIDRHGGHVFTMNGTVQWPGNEGPPNDRPHWSRLEQFYGADSRKGNNITIGLLVPFSITQGYGTHGAAGKFHAAGITVAVDKINKDQTILPGHHINFYWADTECSEQIGINSMLGFLEKRVDAILGFACQCVISARIAASMNIPLISHLCKNDKVSDKSTYPTFARTIPADGAIGPSIVALLNYFQWSTVGIVSEESPSWQNRGAFVEKYLKEDGKNVTYHGTAPLKVIYTPDKYEVQIKDTLTALKAKTRVIIFITTYMMAREFVYFSAEMGMDNGEFAFIIIELVADEVKNRNEDQARWFNGKRTSTYKPTKGFKRAFQSVLLMTVNTQGSQKNDAFKYEVKKKTREAPFYADTYYGTIVYPPPIGPVDKSNLKVPVFASYLHDAVVVYAMAVNKTIQQGHNISDGRRVAKNMFGTKYQSILGTDVYMSDKGDVEYNLTLMDYKWNATNMWMKTVGVFQITANKNTSQTLVLYRNASILWLNNGKPPVDVPACGFTGELCNNKTFELTTIEIVCIVLASLLLIVFFAGGVIYRKQQLIKELESEQWRVDFKDIVIRSRQMGSLRSQVSLVSVDSFDNINQRQIFTTVGVYKSNMVAIKRVNKRQIELTREIKYELKLMRTVRHENLAHFAGACVDPPNICILLHYCPKGSLQDILENDDIKLDSMFVNSLLTDIVKGMAYIHSTEIRSHGRLKSSNCVVDGRWVLKITDYGLTKFRSSQDPMDDEGEYATYYRKLWTAPELLRSPHPPPQGTQRGDVYSFGIILQELLTRSGPFDLTYYSTEPIDIIERVTAVESPPFRPKLSNIMLDGSSVPGIKDMAEWCWNDNPDQRPDFEEIRKALRKLPMGKQTNIMDNMVNMLEKYANNLESLVEERTGQLAEEKRKTENLLNRMLPPTVARDLVQGKPVAAENFDDVSIFFSDIVGFTALSSESTPLQVVDLLNDLYTLFDEIINNYDVYKVETIGDAYMVVSGLPIRNGKKHAGEIASMALHMLRDINSFKIRHQPNYKLKLRIGIHSGSACAGVVGKKMPRYCLFGDTVNTASRMESNGEALKIHISPTTKKVLDELGGYHIEERGEVFLKGKGTWLTYWLVGSDVPPRTVRPTSTVKDRKLEGNILSKGMTSKESKWSFVKNMLPKISKPETRNGKLPALTAEPEALKTVNNSSPLPPITS